MGSKLGLATRRLATGAATVLALVVAWYVATTATGLIGAGRFPSPAEFLSALRQIAVDGYGGAVLHVQALHSLRLVALGFLVAVAVGVPLGLAMGWSQRVESFVNPIFLVLRPIPPLAWIPLAIVWLGLGDGAKILVIFFAAFVPAVINTWTGVRNIDPTLIAAARVHGASFRELLLDVAIPGALPMIFTGLRLALQASWTTLVAAELVGAFFGLGRVLNLGYQDIYPAMIAVAMVAVGALGMLTTRLLGLLETRVIRWRSV